MSSAGFEPDNASTATVTYWKQLLIYPKIIVHLHF